MDRTFRPPGGRVSSALVVSGLCLAALFVAATGGAAASCSDYGIKPFKCGVGLPSDKDVAQSCTEPGQICVCKTHDCAEEVDTSVCESGYRYVKGPYANPPDSLRGISADTGGAGGATSAATVGAAGGGGETASTTSDDRCVPVKFAGSPDNIKSTDDNKFCPGEEPKGGSDAGTAGAGGSGGATGTGGMSGGTGGMTGSGGMPGGAGGGTTGTGGATGGATTTSAAGSGTGGSQ